jgi:allophanate hydrolase subunit 2
MEGRENGRNIKHDDKIRNKISDRRKRMYKIQKNSKSANENPVFQIGILVSIISKCLSKRVDVRMLFVTRFTVSKFSRRVSHRCILTEGCMNGGMGISVNSLFF